MRTRARQGGHRYWAGQTPVRDSCAGHASHEDPRTRDDGTPRATAWPQGRASRSRPGSRQAQFSNASKPSTCPDAPSCVVRLWRGGSDLPRRSGMYPEDRCLRRCFHGDVDDAPLLSELERELLDCASMAGETTATLDEEMLQSSPGRAVVEATLRGLVDRGLMTTTWGRFLGGDPHIGITDYEDDWWDVTPAGRAAIGMPPKPPPRFRNPSSGPFRVSPLIAPWCAWRVRHRKRPLPDWYLRLTKRPGARPRA
jgi:hypothetical protein